MADWFPSGPKNSLLPCFLPDVAGTFDAVKVQHQENDWVGVLAFLSLKPSFSWDRDPQGYTFVVHLCVGRLGVRRLTDIAW